MTNPVFNNSPVFGDPNAPKRGGTATRARAGGAPSYGTPSGAAAYGTAGAASADAAQLQGMYDAPAATTADTRRMTYDDVIIKTGGLLALLVVVAGATWALTPVESPIWMLGAVVGLVLGLVNAFKKQPSPLLITLYTLAQGVFLGGISQYYSAITVSGNDLTGVVPMAVLATLCTFGASLFLFRSGKIRVTPKFTRFLIIGMVGYLAFSLVNMLLVMFGVMDGWGMRSGGLGIVVSLFAVSLAAMSLIVDFDAIKRGVENGVPAKFAWSAAFGLMVTLIWLYLEFLRLFAILQGRD
ncbi:hypothetical protein GCM10025865_20680 [Paraoerskovia sediminicola]|uniref:YccA/Bax inhibitor family protein n=1 Tax=Paraoerskovia sediminicola TaxID=1138587 RepID=A0ABM8G3S1_9CELL|nr:Bax inhibitor-1/YccA family protein [Paraoerskovia sediminicola]BDZ42769.1 hypothetical protein GCM10025865_20680 [Paraoerskovia sediminicola]